MSGEGEGARIAAELNETAHAVLLGLWRTNKPDWLSENERRFLTAAGCVEPAEFAGRFRITALGRQVARAIDAWAEQP